MEDVLHPSEIQKYEAEAAFLRAGIEVRGLEAERARQLLADWGERHENELASLERARIYRFFDEVKHHTVEMAVEKLDYWSRRYPGEEITIEFNSPGGSVLHGLALYDFIQEVRRRGHHVTTIMRGMAASMGGVLLQAGDVRVADENAHLMIHELSSLGMGKLSEIQDEVKFMARLQNERLVPILAKRSNLSEAQIKRRMSRTDWWLSAAEALEDGFVDRVDYAPDFNYGQKAESPG